MPWWQLSVQSDPQQLAQTEQALLELGALSLSISDARDEPIYEPLPGEEPLWSLSVITALFDQEQDIETLFDGLVARLPSQQLASIRKSKLADQQWERVHLERYQPMPFGQRLWVCPSWIDPPQADACNIILDPGIAFGTGSHPTTALCLEYLDRYPPVSMRVMDYGCGSGILAIAAARLGAKHIDCIDIDPQALNATIDNIGRNALDPERFSVYLPTAQSLPAVDYLIANILAGPLQELEPLFAEVTRPGGRILLSGILDHQVDHLLSVYARHFELDTATIRDQWCRISGTRRN
jgi:ribosomal protein L11 methyltransferase